MLNGVTFSFVKDVLDVWYSGDFYLQLWGNSENNKKTKGLNKDEIKKQLIESTIINNAIQIDNLNELAEKVEKPEDAATITKQYNEVLSTKRQDILSVAYHQGKFFKRFKQKGRFIEMVSTWKIHISTIIFRINIFKLIQKHPKLMKPSATRIFLKNYLKDIKQISKEISSEFE